uniref:Uncharacterized protein n=1 Tax=Meloidogyne enterolobii TaxID=390850 RepID=A0A6V7X8G9_MELEN|nr:unnamed protein product [Meloidogyne enterolobii]
MMLLCSIKKGNRFTTHKFIIQHYFCYKFTIIISVIKWQYNNKINIRFYRIYI